MYLYREEHFAVEVNGIREQSFGEDFYAAEQYAAERGGKVVSFVHEWMEQDDLEAFMDQEAFDGYTADMGDYDY